MVILDADSLMTGEALVRLAAAMESQPQVGLIQTLPLMINRNTLFARRSSLRRASMARSLRRAWRMAPRR